tara:strand:- start:1190 stop:2500 length:1311 start_codon:yes stop_codon:yes gene_type:complete
MAYLHEFSSDSIFRNSIKTEPKVAVSMYSGSMFVNKQRFDGINSSSAEGMVTPVPTGSVSLFELNVGTARAGDGFLIRPFVVKDGTNFSFKNISRGAYNEADNGTILFGKYPLTSSIAREFIPSKGATPSADTLRGRRSFTKPFITNADSYDGAGGLLFFETRKRIVALRNTLEFYKNYSNTFGYTGSYETASVNLISIPSIFYGSGIKRGSVSLKFYITGTLIDEAQDIRHNGELISITTTSPVSGQVVGNILYNEGFVLLTGTTDIGTVDEVGGFGGDTYEFDGTHRLPKWIYFGAFASGTMANAAPSASLYEMSFRGTNEVPVLTMFAEAEAGDLNSSQNPTWVSSSMKGWTDKANKKVKYDRGSFREPEFLEIKNTSQNNFCLSEEEFEKQVFISKIGIFDKDKNLIGIAKLANPVLKKESDDFTFKLKMDF